MSNLLCSFEESCSWVMVEASNGTWKVGEAKDNSEGPHYDHTQQNEKGHYAFLTEPDHHKSTVTGMYAKPELSTEPICINFWYHMVGANQKQLSLQAAVGSKNIGIYAHNFFEINLNFARTIGTRISNKIST